MAATDNLVAHWKFNESSGNATDAHTNGYTLTDNNTVGANASGKIDGSRSFVRTNNEHFTASQQTDFQIADTLWNLYFWYKPGDTGTREFPFVKQTASSYEWRIDKQSTNIMRFQVRNAADSSNISVEETTVGALSASTWYYICMYHDPTANEIGISVNNNTFDTASISGGVNTGTGSLYVGSFDGTQLSVQGELDSISMWKSGTPGTSCTDAYNSGSGLDYPFGATPDTFRPIIISC